MDAIIHHLHHHNADANAIGLSDSRRHSPSCFHARWTVILNNMSDQGECELISFCILPGRAFNFLSLQTPVFFYFLLFVSSECSIAQRHTLAHTRSDSASVFYPNHVLLYCRSPRLTILITLALQNPAQNKSFHYSSKRTGLLNAGLPPYVCVS